MKKRDRFLIIVLVIMLPLSVYFFLQHSHSNEIKSLEREAFFSIVNQQIFNLKDRVDTLLLYEDDFNDRELKLFQDSLGKSLSQFSYPTPIIRDLELYSLDTARVYLALFDDQATITWTRFVLNNDNPNKEFIKDIRIVLNETIADLTDMTESGDTFGVETYERLQEIITNMTENIVELSDKYS